MMLRNQGTMLETQCEHTKLQNINKPSIEAETCSLSMKSDKIKRDKEVVNRIDLIAREFLKLIGDDFYQYAISFDLQKEKLKFK